MSKAGRVGPPKSKRVLEELPPSSSSLRPRAPASTNAPADRDAPEPERLGPRLVRRANELSHKSDDRDEGVDPWSFHVAQPNARDARKLQCRVEPEIEAMIETMIASKLFRWGSVADFVRWCVCGDGMGIERAQRFVKDQDLNNAVRSMNALNQIVRMKTKQRDMVASLRGVREFLQEQVRAGAIRQVKRDLASLRAQIAKMDVGYYKERGEALIEEFDAIVEAEELAAAGARARASKRAKARAKSGGDGDDDDE